jgi:recombination protein RecA
MAKKDDLATLIAENLNKMESGRKVAYFLGNEYAPTHFRDWISTGSSILDIAISNRKNGGIACGRITELQGNEGSGKSLIAAHLLADTQHRGGVAVLIDTETAVNHDFFNAVGLEMGPGKMLYVSENVLEKIFEQIEKIIEVVRKADKDRLITIVVDSVAGATTEEEVESEHGRDGYATGKAIIISKALRKITKMIGDHRIALVFTNQLRTKLNASPFSDPYTTSGGKSLAFHASTRIRLALTGNIKNANKEVVGVKVKAKVIKNRCGPPYREAFFNILFDRGIDDYGSWYDVMKERKVIKVAGSWATWNDPETSEEHKFQKSTLEELLNDEKIRKKMYDQICDAMIMTYSGPAEELEESEESPEEM